MERREHYDPEDIENLLQERDFEELLDEETDNMAYTGMTAHYIYEEFYPNDEYDVKMWSEDFLLALLRQDEIDDLDYRIGKDELWDSRGNAISHEEFLKQLGRFRKQHRAISNVTITPLTSLITGDEASVVVATTFTSLPAGFNEFIETIGHTKLSLKRSPYYGWDIHQVILPGTHPL